MTDLQTIDSLPAKDRLIHYIDAYASAKATDNVLLQSMATKQLQTVLDSLQIEYAVSQPVPQVEED